MTGRLARMVASAGALVAALLLACEGVGPKLRQHTYPPDFRYVSQDEIVGAMWQVAELTQRLDELTRAGAEPDAHREEIRSLLARLQQRIDALKPEDVSTHHPLLNANLDRFRHDIQRARLEVDREPPSYLRATAVPRACVYCHSG